jgi:hypothetical protein
MREMRELTVSSESLLAILTAAVIAHHALELRVQQ